MLAVALDELADETGAGVFYRVVRQVQDLQASVLHVYLAVGRFFDLKHERHWLFRRSLLALLVALYDLVSRLLFQLMLLVFLLRERHFPDAVEEQPQEVISAQCVF